jgi:hypothetical protein
MEQIRDHLLEAARLTALEYNARFDESGERAITAAMERAASTLDQDGSRQSDVAAAEERVRQLVREMAQRSALTLTEGGGPDEDLFISAGEVSAILEKFCPGFWPFC